MRTDELDFELPAELIAQVPADRRDEARLLHYRRADALLAHRRFSDLPSLLRRGDLLVFNDSRVIPARFALRKQGGGLVEGLFIDVEPDGHWRVMLRNAGPRAAGRSMTFADAPSIVAQVVRQLEDGQYLLKVNAEEAPLDLLQRLGRMPLPPYIRRQRLHDRRDALDRERYQTVYARLAGSIAAPTAGLHFTPALLTALEAAGVRSARVTLHVGLGTFKPVTADTLEAHTMHSEAYSISAEAAEALNAAKREGRRIVAVGTTVVRVLESQPPGAAFAPREGRTGIFIHPPYQWRHVDALITNFHLPRSTLIALVAAFVGLPQQRQIYREAIAHRYRFFSYGDAMLAE